MESQNKTLDQFIILQDLNSVLPPEPRQILSDVWEFYDQTV